MSINSFGHHDRDFYVGFVVLAGGAMLPAPAVLASSRISCRLKRVQRHVSPVNVFRNTVQSAQTQVCVFCVCVALFKSVSCAVGTASVGSIRMWLEQVHCSS